MLIIITANIAKAGYLFILRLNSVKNTIWDDIQYDERIKVYSSSMALLLLSLLYFSSTAKKFQLNRKYLDKKFKI